jgi:lysylphosphatidylglycerol synthase-like protein
MERQWCRDGLDPAGGAGSVPMTRRRVLPLLLTIAILAAIGRRMPARAFIDAVASADYVLFLAVMIPNTLFYFLWDTLILKRVLAWFHGEVPYLDLLPVRAASYVVGFFNTNAGRGALAGYLWRRLDAPFLELGSTVIFLVLTEYTQLVLWSLCGVFAFRTEVTTSLLPVAAAVALFWVVFFAYSRMHVTPARAVRWLFAPREWQVFRTFRLAAAGRYFQMVLLRAPMFAVSLGAHYVAARAFGLAIPFGSLLTFLPVIFMAAALPVTVAHLGTTQAAWLYFFGQYAPAPRVLAFSLIAHLTFAFTRALLGVIWLPVAYSELTRSAPAAHPSHAMH